MRLIESHSLSRRCDVCPSRCSLVCFVHLCSAKAQHSLDLEVQQNVICAFLHRILKMKIHNDLIYDDGRLRLNSIHRCCALSFV